MPSPQMSSNAEPQHQKKWLPRVLIGIVLFTLLVPLVLRALVGFSPVVDVKERVDLLGGRASSSVAVPEFLRSMMGEDWNGWEGYYGGVEVTKIMLAQSAVRDEDLVLLAKTPGLRGLQLRGTRVTDAGMEYLSHSPRLEELDLGQTDVTDAGMDQLQSLSDLRHLSIADTRVSDVGAAKLTELQDLTDLDLSGTVVTDASLSVLSQLPELTKLVLDDCDLTDEGLKSLKNCRSLTYLSLKGVEVTGSFLNELTNVPLEFLDLAQTQCDGTALTAVGNSDAPTMLSLNLSDCPVEDAGIDTIAAIPGLESLILDRTEITAEAMSGLKDMVWLRSLSINSTPVTAEALRELKDNPKLSLVKAYDTQITRGDVDTLGAEIKSFAITIASGGGG